MEHQLYVTRWFNAPESTTLASLRGEERRVVAVLAFQMLCPGCVATAIPQLKKVRASFGPEQLAVVGLHTVFEHHEAMTPLALQAFLHEYRLPFPVAVDAPSDSGAIPRTMAAYEMEGTPTLLLFDRDGTLRLNHFGHIEDLALGAVLGRLLASP
jgi:hypothetical protein